MVNKMNYARSKWQFNHMIATGINNQYERPAWLKTKLQAFPAGFTLLDAGAGELRNKTWLAMPMLGLMRLMKAGSRGSYELLTFGLQVVARRP